MVTKENAWLDLMFRIRDNRRFATNPKGACVYDQNVNGGCAIGHFLPDNDAADLSGAVEYLFTEFPHYTAHFEDPFSPFWRTLQRVHDNFATGDFHKGAHLLMEEVEEVE